MRKISNQDTLCLSQTTNSLTIIIIVVLFGFFSKHIPGDNEINLQQEWYRAYFFICAKHLGATRSRIDCSRPSVP